MRLLSTFTLLLICLTAFGQTFPKKDRRHPVDTLVNGFKKQKPLTFYPGTYIDTESGYIDSTGISVIIQNSLPKGGAYTDPAGKNIQYRIFWTRVINESQTSLELTINFSGSTVPLTPPPDPYLQLFLPPDTMTLSKEGLYDYGATGLKSFIDSGLNKSTTLKRTINPKEACLFYIGAVIGEGGFSSAARAGLVLKGRNVFYTIKGISEQLDSALIPCGQIVIKNE